MLKFPVKIARIACVLLITPFFSIAQTLPAGSAFEDYYRREQLLGGVDKSISFTVKPLSGDALKRTEYLEGLDSANKVRPVSKSTGKFQYRILPLNWEQQLNTKNPYGWNDGAMVSARGYQSLLSAGVWGALGPISVQLKPEYVFAQNSDFEGFSNKHPASIWAYYVGDHNLIDVPERFGKGAYSKLYPGQSSVRINYGPVSLGVSTENMWWGPGIRNSLLMSNNAPGFAHLTMNTTRPVKTPVGSFEGQLIGGHLESSGYPSALPKNNTNNLAYTPKREEWRYLSGIVATYQPKWVPGLFLGVSRIAQLYHSDLDGLGDYISVFKPIQKKNTGNDGTTEDEKKRDQLGSLFLRWVWQDGLGEIYFEYGHSDFNYDFRDMLLQSSHTAAYTIGVKKLLKLNSGDHIQVDFELNQLQRQLNTNRQVPSWYSNGQVRQGYTHLGQVIGAGIGKGGNLESLGVSWVSGIRRFGLQAERYAHDNDFFQVAIKDIRSNWVDLTFSGFGVYDYKRYVFTSTLTYINSFNYQWYYQKADESIPFWSPGINTHNVQVKVGLGYRF